MEASHPASAISLSKVTTFLLFVFFAEIVRSQAQCLETLHWIRLDLVPAPIGRQKHAMAYDAARGQMVLFGGSDVVTFRGTNEIYGDTWEFNGASWQQRFPAHSPSARFGHTMTYDARRGVTVLFGGRGDGNSAGGGASDEVWEWNGGDWSRITVTSGLPEARAYHGMAYDSARGVHIMYGGSVGTSLLGDTWEYDGAARTWTLRAPPNAGPGPRIWFQLAFDAARTNTLLFGGTQDGTVQLGDTWTWNGTAAVWTQHYPPDHPRERQLYAMAYDSVREVALLQCGAMVQGGSTLIDSHSWEWNGSTWTNLTSAYDFCCPRSGAGMVYDSHVQQMALFGGYGAFPEAVWALRSAWDGSYAYVDWQNSGTQDGSAAQPYRTLRQAVDAVPDCWFLSVQAGDYPEGALTINRPIKLEARNGPVQIH